jgi:asparagine synthase (glutamine-hydrolysing)
MCGIYALLNGKQNYTCHSENKNLFLLGKNRGPEQTNYFSDEKYDYTLGFHRLAINGFNDEKSEQPFKINNIDLICNGEIYNHKQLYNIMDITPNSRSDCEVIIHLYLKYGIKHTLQLLDGVFAFTLVDKRDTKCPKVFFARDSYGVRPLFYGKSNTCWFFSSEMKQIHNSTGGSSGCWINYDDIYQFKPGSYSCFKYNDTKFEAFSEEKNKYIEELEFVHYNSPTTFINHQIDNEEYACTIIRNSLIDAVKKRVENTERDIACLLSGGLDSSLIAGLVNSFCEPGKLHTWSIGFEGSEDLKYAKMVADHLGTNHHPIVLTENDFLEAIETVIYTIESYDTTTVRASVGNWLISKYIKENSDAKVVFNGDGSDEVTGGYMYFHCAPDELDFDKECRRLLSDIHYFDVLRSDRSISSHGLEARTPFLDRNFVQNYLSIPYEFRYHKGNNQCEKYLLRKAFENDNILPKEVLWRTKEAFSDGVSKQTRSWYTIIQEYCRRIFSVPQGLKESIFVDKNVKLMNIKSGIIPKTLEQLHYRMLYDKYYKNQYNVVPYFWMPKFVNATDSSARTLDIYKEKTKHSINGKNKEKVSNGKIISYT